MALPHGKVLGRLGPGLLCAAAGAAAIQLSCQTGPSPARCEMPTAPSEPPVPPTAVSVAAMRKCLERQGADVRAIDFKASPTDEGRFGLFANAHVREAARRGWWGTLKAAFGRGNPNLALASFPLEGALTASNVLKHDTQQTLYCWGPVQAGVLRELAELGLVDERTLVILHLIVERLRGRNSKICPWLTLLPKEFSSTLFFNERELDWLRGTTLHKATVLRKQTLEEQWRRLEPACTQIALQEGADSRPTLSDFLWAYSVFWSRAISFPCPTPSGGVEMEEGIIPGLDFANHKPGSQARWTVFGAADKPGKAPPTHVTLICPRKALPKPGQEVTISYGAKSNDDLLFLYGFALKDNPDEVLMVPCPLPPASDWDENLKARMQLLHLRGLKPGIFLPAAFLEAQHERSRRSSKQGGSGWWRPRRRGTSEGTADAAAGGQGLGADLPQDVFDTLEVFVMERRQLDQELARNVEGGQVAGVAGAATAQGRGELSEVERSGLCMAVLTTLVHMLEVKALDQEGEEGTGSLEQDMQLLEAAGNGRGRLGPRERAALYYRMGQKALTREYLIYAKGLLQREMQTLKALMGSPNAEP